jgi:hypothetical protein
MTTHQDFIRQHAGVQTGFDREVNQVATAYAERDERIVRAGVNLGAGEREVRELLVNSFTAPQAARQAADNGDLAAQVAELTRTVQALVNAARDAGVRVNV